MRARAAAIGVGAAGLVLALVFVRVSLDWSDRQPYDPAVTEPRYLVLIGIAGLIAAAGVATAVWLWRRR